jgi:amidase
MFRYAFLLLLIMFFGCTQDKETNAINEKIRINVEELTIKKIQNAYANGDYTIIELVQAYINRIDSLDKNGPQLNSIILVNPDALAIAKQLDEELKSGKSRGPLHGIPVILKDNIDTYDKMPTTAGAMVLKDSKPLQDSWVAQKLRESGAIILGKSNLSEWANFHSSFSSSGWSAVGGQTKNPYELSRNPCGSSSGSGVAVAANLTLLAIGTETNGSIVCPANNNGIVGIKPTVGLISRSGIIPISFTQDTPGPMARTVTDAAICLGMLTGLDESDSKTLLSEGKRLTDYTPFLKKDGIKGKTIGVWKEPLGKHFRVDSVFQQAVEDLKNQGATIVEIDKISPEDIEGPSYLVLLYEFKDGLNRYLTSLGEDAKVKSLTELVALTLNDSIEMQYFDHSILPLAESKGDLSNPEYIAALRKMLLNSQKNGIDRVMETYQLDAIVAPTGGTAWKTDLTNGDHFGVYSSSPAAIAGYPAITVPMGELDGLPLGISFFGKAWSEPILIEIAYAYEQATLHRKMPQFKP